METEELKAELDKNRVLNLLGSFAEVGLVLEISIIFIIISSGFGIFLISNIILFFIGKAFTRWYARKKELDDSNRKAYNVNLIWLMINIPLEFLIFFFLGNSIIFVPLRIAIEIIILSVVVMNFYNINFLKESLLFTTIVQVLLYLVAINIGIILNVILIMFTGSERVFGAGIMFLFCVIIILGITIFYVSWGNKIQFVKDKYIIVLIAVTIGLSYMGELFYSQPMVFMRNYTTNVLLTAIISIIVAKVGKILFQRTVTYEEYRDVITLEKDKLLLDIKDLKVYYPLIGGMLKRQFGSVKAVDGVSFYINTGETVGLVGESGCGKTTVANAILGLVTKESGEINFSDEPIPNNYTKHLRKKIQIVFQDPDASLNPRMKVVNIIAEPLINLLGITKKYDIRTRVLELLDEVSLKREHMDRFPHEFSGGQKQRIIIARALASNPELIILDEPTSALDVSVQAQILNLLKKLQKTYNYGFLFITHNLSVVNHIADRVAVMYLGKFVEVGETDQIFSNPTHPYTQALLASRIELDPTNKEISFVIKGEVPSPITPPPGCHFNPRCVSDARTKECEFELPHQIKIEEGHYIWCVNPPVSKNKGDIKIKDNVAIE
ncbi:hypothetical protein LCGC14_0641090 [marine sediment metagenome]|uniref:ABC transporter domain-containing protein n=1 Tax=marine sediment metagenome TaxID=412755 RepID=A0A0F9TKJ7_9ZZZZ